MQMILKSGGFHVEVNLADHKQAVNLKWMCKMLDVNYNTVCSYINRDGLSVDVAIKRALANGEVV